VPGDDSVERCSLGAAAGVPLWHPVRCAGPHRWTCRWVANGDHGRARRAVGLPM
jgi:hypothetical protein